MLVRLTTCKRLTNSLPKPSLKTYCYYCCCCRVSGAVKHPRLSSPAHREYFSPSRRCIYRPRLWQQGRRFFHRWLLLLPRVTLHLADKNTFKTTCSAHRSYQFRCEFTSDGDQKRNVRVVIVHLTSHLTVSHIPLIYSAVEWGAVFGCN